MDKNNIIEEILNEWAMHSEDGLVGGHDTPENMAVLNEILEARGRPVGWVPANFLKPIDPKDKGTKDPSKLMVYNNHQKYEDGTRYSDILNGTASKKGDIPFPIQSDEDKARKELNPKYFRQFHGYWVTDEHPN